MQIFPVYALTGNIILSYNLLFLSTFVLSGLGMFLFVREVTGSARAGFVAGLIYAFAPYRVPQFAHLQVISSQWMPFVLYGLRRYFETRHVRALAGAGAALVAQNLSNGYFLLFFAPFVLAYVLFEIATRRLWATRACGRAVGHGRRRDGCDAAVSSSLSRAAPPRARRARVERGQGILGRRVQLLDVSCRIVGVGARARAYPKAEGDLFPTVAALILGVHRRCEQRLERVDVTRAIERAAASWAPMAHRARRSSLRRRCTRCSCC